MRFKIYFIIEVNSFDPAKFNSRLDQSNVGEVIQRKNLSKARLNSPANRLYWRSKSYEITDAECPEDKMLQLISAVTENIKALCKTECVHVSANIVEYLQDKVDSKVFYLSSELRTALAHLNADMDIDIVHDLKH